MRLSIPALITKPHTPDKPPDMSAVKDIRKTTLIPIERAISRLELRNFVRKPKRET